MIRAAVYGYGNLGRAVCQLLGSTPDMRLEAIYTRRAAQLQRSEPQRTAVPFLDPEALDPQKDAFDILINCGGSAKELPRTTAALAGHFCVVDSFDDHPAIPEHFAAVDTAARAGKTLCIVSAGWDPGLFSLARILGAAIVPHARLSTFWGPGVSQGHSDALRHLPGVVDARQYTLPDQTALEQAQQGQPVARETARHRRLCYVAAEPGTDLPSLENAIRTLPHYFAGYETEIRFLSPEQLRAEHGTLPHGGRVVCSTPAGTTPTHLLELQLATASNPMFTAGILIACARAAVRLHRTGECGCRTMADIPPAIYSPEDPASLRAKYL